MSVLRAIAPAVRVTRTQARAFALRALGLHTPHADVAAALAHHGYVQIDPLNICGRMHDHILRTRVADYAEGGLWRALHGPALAAPLGPAARTAFEHHLPGRDILVALESAAWPHLHAAMRARARRASHWSGRLTARETACAREVLAELAQRGPLGPGDFAPETRRSDHPWGQATLAKATLQKLFFHGRVLIAARDTAGRRRYDLPARVLPPKVLARPVSAPLEADRWNARLKLRQWRLARLNPAEVKLLADEILRVELTDALLPGRWYCLRTDAPLLQNGLTELAATPPRLIAPLDPLIYDRALTRALWAFDYTWEVYTPAAKRRRGYYALPLLNAAALVGHVDPKADRATARLRVMGRAIQRGHATAAKIATADLAHFLGLRVAAR
jgi:uncharacterized protein